MTEKRFTHKKWYDNRQLFDGDEAFAIVDVYNQAVTICNKLNELEEENRELKEQLKDCTKKAKEEIRKQREENAIRWANIGR